MRCATHNEINPKPNMVVTIELYDSTLVQVFVCTRDGIAAFSGLHMGGGGEVKTTPWNISS